MTDMHDAAKLDDLIVTTIDSVRGYENAAEHADAERYVEFFRDTAHERHQVIELLTAQSRAVGGTPAEYGSTAATIHRRWQDLRTAFGGGDAAIVKEVERGEDYLMEEWGRVMDDDRMSPGTMAVLRPAFDTVRRGHDRASALKHALEAAD